MTNTETIQFEKIIKTIPYGLIVIDKQWKVLLFNAEASILTGYSPKQIVGSDIRDQIKFLRIQDKQNDYTIIENTFTSGQGQQQSENLVIVSSSNTEVPISISTAAITDRLKKVNQIVIIFRDLNKEKGIFRLRSDFNYLQHQLRTPLSSALWNMQMAKEATGLDKKTKELITSALNSIESVKLLSNTLIEVSQVDQGLITPNIQVVKVEKVINAALNAVQEIAKSKDITINIKFDDKNLTFSTDPLYCARIIEEILKNAIQYSKAKSQVNLTVTSEASGTMFEISDKGIGISSEENALIFTKFFRGWNTANSQPGAGLGLYLALRYAKLLKGKIWFVSKENEGTSFSVVIPSLHAGKHQVEGLKIDTKQL